METTICWIQTALSMDLLKNILVSIPGVVLLVFSLYFAYQKLGNNILTTFSIVYSGVTENRISEITLINKKNKPVTIFSIHAVINEDIVVEVESFQPAMILKPLESVYIETTPFSYLHIGNDRYEAEYLQPNKIDLYLITEKNKIKCTVIRPPNLSKYFDFKHYKNATKSSMKYNGKVYNDRVKYAIVYRMNDKEYTAFIEESGFIGEEWEYQFNMVPSIHMETKEKVKEYFIELGYDKFFQAFVIDDMKKR